MGVYVIKFNVPNIDIYLSSSASDVYSISFYTCRSKEKALTFHDKEDAEKYIKKHLKHQDVEVVGY